MEKFVDRITYKKQWILKTGFYAILVYLLMVSLFYSISDLITNHYVITNHNWMGLSAYVCLISVSLVFGGQIKRPMSLLYFGIVVLTSFEIGHLFYNNENAVWFSIVLLILLVMSVVFWGKKVFVSDDDLLREAIDSIANERHESNQKTHDLMAMYEELEATDEEIRAQYQELLENRNHLKMIQRRNNLLFKASNEVIWDLDLKTGIRHFAEENYVDEVALDLIQSVKFEDWAYDLHPDDQKPFADAMDRVKTGQTRYEVFEIRVTDLNGGWKWLRSKVVSLVDEEGNTVLMAGSYSDIDDKKKKEERIQYLAYHDQLTGLGNRLSLLDLIAKNISCVEAETCQGIFYYIDMDGFGAINNTYGHDVGDRLICEISKRLKAFKFHHFIARLAGADYGLLLCSETLCDSAVTIALELLEILKAPYILDEREIYLTASIGVNVYRSNTDAELVIRHADIALRQAKMMGGNCFVVYDTKMLEAVSERILMANALRNAIQREELYLMFQPQVCLEMKNTFGFEALLRWKSPEYGDVSPLRFIPIAEETGLIIPIGKWVFEKACNFLKEISKIDQRVIVSVNVAAQQLEQQNFVEDIKEILKKTNVTPSNMCIEITESSVIQALDTTLLHLNSLKEENILIALDDFGTGYSSLNYLNALPIDILKIDKSFTSRISSSSKEYTLIRSIMGLSEGLGLHLIIEGVETQEQVDLIAKMGDQIIQGYFFGEPYMEKKALSFLGAHEGIKITKKFAE